MMINHQQCTKESALHEKCFAEFHRMDLIEKHFCTLKMAHYPKNIVSNFWTDPQKHVREVFWTIVNKWHWTVCKENSKLYLVPKLNHSGREFSAIHCGSHTGFPLCMVLVWTVSCNDSQVSGKSATTHQNNRKLFWCEWTLYSILLKRS